MITQAQKQRGSQQCGLTFSVSCLYVVCADLPEVAFGQWFVRGWDPHYFRAGLGFFTLSTGVQPALRLSIAVTISASYTCR